MSKNCGHKVPCGCGDQPLNTQPPCNQTGPCAGEPCSELFCEECIVHCQPDMEMELREGRIVIPQGMRLDAIIQTLIVAMVDQNCLGVAAVGLQVPSKTSDSITIKWNDEGYDYRVHWQEGLNSFSALVNGVNTYTFTGLVPDTEYTIFIETEGTTCRSVTLKVKTLSV